MTSNPSISGLATPAEDLLRLLDRGLTAADLDRLPTDRLRKLSGLLDHWSELANHQLEQRSALLHRQAG